MKLSRVLALGGLVLSAVSALSDRDGTMETATEIAMLAKAFGAGPADPGQAPDHQTAPDRQDQVGTLLGAFLK